MLSSDNRASLAGDPRGAQETATESDAGPPPAASLVAVPRGGARQRLMAKVAEAAAAKEPPAATDALENGDAVLASKGDASASGFRPWYWSYERDGGPRSSDSAVSVTPFPASAPPPVAPTDPVSAPATSHATADAPPRRRKWPALLGGGAALALAAGIGYLSLPRPPLPAAPPPVVALAAPPPAESAPAVVAPEPAPPPKPAASPKPAAAVSPAEIAELMARGRQMLATGDIAAARLFFERAAEAGNAAAATAAGKTYDPLFLVDSHARGIRGDPVAAARWYRQASAGGDAEADGLMRRLMEKYAG